MEFKHTSVLFSESIKNLKINPDGVYVDGTLGGGGHASGICEKLNQKGIFIGIDRDHDAIDAAALRLEGFQCQKIFAQNNYANIKDVLEEQGIEKIDGAILDLGVSSFQLDNQERGFSYMQTAALDMRMNAGDTLTAEVVVNEYSQKELTDIIRKYGEERWASRISEFIVKERSKKPIRTTTELVDIIKAAIPASARREGPHPAKRTFQAIRIEVNDELSQLERAVDEFVDVLKDGGRLCIITFHSLEDRIVKDIFNQRANPCTCPKEFPVCVCGKTADVKKISGKPILPTPQELAINPRARSAKLRVIEKKG
ncbi:16S rRNA (cytosine(1402)-N(4))-methyltransferase RsmH [Sinanaerobacter chloroacetimidivorans]|uniref:Ribosomal RNA small subunit methyltransferase H n=1 Tax=Sinanaerobacter chloroacetimidivorans TaxID=2818044 RepID=A0A8J7VXV5_9FIRM|nr:16S rRNA (cytosine(1402)-N(4))-methyltransferase RsmH [Sinanaerobacter chloroacetimidivorans]MBR0597072.1 16S rRNA (cytosine(1402)-N(4))-methyltransferase RsmH [Sinanaerobacter chloroacetimidivorans]